MNEPTLHRRDFLLHLQERPGFDEPVLLKEPAWEQLSGSHLDQLHNEYAVTRQLLDVAGVRPVLAKEGTESRPVLLLEYIKGHSLAELIRSASLDLAEKLRLALNLSRALSDIHEHQVTHKDVSSGNILVGGSHAPGSQGGVYLIDFGSASTLGEERPSRLTADDTLVGTLAYVSPEQTGRMNRHVDHRTDLYSLGVVLYELFTGQLPFEGSDALQMIHAHIARQPEPPNQIDNGIPRPVSDIILKLLAKNAEDRYQSAQGLQIDLERCLDQLRDKGRVEPFALGSDDFTGRLQIPQKLYGRQAEIEQLRAVLAKVVEGSPQLLLVAGYSGVGKTSLVHELQEEVIGRQADFVEGKFDQLQRTLPYSGWKRALTQLVNNWLAGSEEALAQRRETVLEAVDDQAQVLVDFIPALERVVGPQPAVPQLGGIETRNRFNYVFGRFIGGLARPEHPLVVFLDDLQWIDPASLNLIEALFATQSTSRLLVIGAYRSNQVGPDHSLVAAQDRLNAESERMTIVALEDLTPDTTNQMLADTLHLPVRECRDLGRLLVEKTAGNPFYFRQLMFVLESEKLLRFDRPRRRWVWDEWLRQRLQAGGNVVDLMTGRIRALPENTQHTLSIAACLGGRCDASTLSKVAGKPRAEVLTHLDPALRANLLLQSNDHYVFAHDRIQEAAYELIAESRRPRMHLEIGRLLLAADAGDERRGGLFDAVSHLNLGRRLIDAGQESVQLAALNLAAAKKAKAASAFKDAGEFAETGIGLLPPDSWQRHYELSLSLHTEHGELASLTGKLDQVTTAAELIYRNAKSRSDRLRIQMCQIEAETARSNLSRAIELGSSFMRLLGLEIPERPTSIDYQQLQGRLIALLERRSCQDWAVLPEMEDEKSLAASSLLASVLAASYIGSPPVFPIVCYRGAILTLERGIDSWSPFFCASAAMAAVGSVDFTMPAEVALERIRLAAKLKCIAHEMLNKPVTAGSKAKTLLMSAFVSAWTDPIEHGVALTRATYASGKQTGDALYMTFGTIQFAKQAFAAGMNLMEYEENVLQYADDLDKFKQLLGRKWLAVLLQAAQNFSITRQEPERLHGHYVNEDEWLTDARASSDMSGLFTHSVLTMLLTYHFDVDDKLDECAHEAEDLIGGGKANCTVHLLYLYFPLSMLRLARRNGTKAGSEAITRVDTYLRLLEIWSQVAPSTFQHKYDLISAEKARVTGDTDGALAHYERAIAGAGKNGFIREEALANELYARFWAERGDERFAAPLMREAHSLYRKWGAFAKAKHLAGRYPQWLIGRRIVVDEPGTRAIPEEVVGDLDLHTVLKASRDIAGELALDGLLPKLLNNVIENSGAQKGCLILREENQWTIVAEASVDDPQPYARAAESVEETDALAEGIVQYAARMRQTVVLEDASESGAFVQDAYVRAHRARSVLCMPLVNRGRAGAMLYLENNLAPRVFSPERVSLLRLLSSQMAISIENARVHGDLAALLESRSKALASAETQVRTLFEDSPLGVALSNYEGKILAANRAVLEMLRMPEEELLQSSVTGFYSQPNDRDTLLQKLEETGFVQDFGVRLVRGDGAPFFASLNMSKLVLEGNEVLLTMVEDVTDQITAEQESAILEERARLARELHDAVSQTLLSASLLAEATVRDSQEGRAIATEDLADVSRLLRGALDEMRTLLLELRPAALRERTLGQLLGALTETVRARSRAAVDLQIKGDHALPEPVTMTLHRIAQESLTNAVKHAQARTIKVDLVCDPDEVVLHIVDDGLGFDFERSPAGHHGLDIMRERAEEIGALLKIESRVGRGTRITVSWS